MKRLAAVAAAIAAALVLNPGTGAAQPFEAVGTRALGMGGAFVGVADDASAIYWNPGGLAGGAYFSLLVDRNTGKSKPDKDIRGGRLWGTIIAVTTPALGIGYYRLQSATLTPVPTVVARQDRNFRADEVVRVDVLTTHHAGVTLVQSLTGRLAVGTTLKLVRGSAGSLIDTSGASFDALIDHGGELDGSGTTRFDADVGIMAVFGGGVRAGLTVRNLREPEFDSSDGGPVRKLERQARAGISFRTLGILLAADADLTRSAGPVGQVRHIAAGAEARVLPRATLRAGVRVNTVASPVYGHSRVASAGGSVAVTRSASIDGQVSRGAATGSTGWGLAARVGF